MLSGGSLRLRGRARPSRPRRPALLLAACTALVLLTACGTEAEDTPPRFVVGVQFDQPGLGYQGASGDLNGFEADLARYLAAGLGVTPAELEFVEAPPDDHDDLLADEVVEFVLASRPMTDEVRGGEIVGPYLLTGQDLLVRREERRITGPHSLDGRRLCRVPGSDAARSLKDERYSPRVRLVSQPSQLECLTALVSNRVDAVTGDSVALFGLADDRASVTKVVNAPITRVGYGVALPPDSPHADEIRDLLQESFDDGTWARWYEQHFGGLGYSAPPPPTLQ